MIRIDDHGGVRVITLDRPARRNAVDRQTADALADAFRVFDESPDLGVAILTGVGTFCAGADLLAFHEGAPNHLDPDGDGPMGPTRMSLTKPVIAAIEGHAVAGGLELAIWCDLRVAAADAQLGVFCRRWGVPLIDGGTVRLPRLIGLGRAMDLILTGRAVSAEEAHRIGLVDRLVAPGTALTEARALAQSLLAFPQACLRADLMSARHAFDGPVPRQLHAEFDRGVAVLGEADVGRFVAGEGRGGG